MQYNYWFKLMLSITIGYGVQLYHNVIDFRGDEFFSACYVTNSLVTSQSFQLLNIAPKCQYEKTIYVNNTDSLFRCLAWPTLLAATSKKRKNQEQTSWN